MSAAPTKLAMDRLVLPTLANSLFLLSVVPTQMHLVMDSDWTGEPLLLILEGREKAGGS